MWLNRLREHGWVLAFYVALFVVLVAVMALNPLWGHNGDLFFCNRIWCNDLRMNGITLHGWINYFPLGRYYYWAFGVLKGSQWAIDHNMWQFKIGHLFLDLIIVLMSYFSIKQYKLCGFKTAWAWSLFIGLNLAFWFDSWVWGQMDSLYILLLFGAILCLIKNRLYLFVAVVILGLNAKPQFIGYLPFLGLGYLAYFKPSAKQIIYSLILAGGMMVLILSPFIWQDFPNLTAFKADLVRIYITPIQDSHNYLSVSATNFWTLMYGSDAFKMPSQQPMNALMSFKSFSMLMFLGFILLMLVFLTFTFKKHQYDLRWLVLVAAVVCMAFYLVPANMHERYLQPAVLFMGLYAILKGKIQDIGLYVCFCVFYLMTLANENRESAGLKLGFHKLYLAFPIEIISLVFILIWLKLCFDLYHYKSSK